MNEGKTICGHDHDDWRNYGSYSECSVCGELDINYIDSSALLDQERPESIDKRSEFIKGLLFILFFILVGYLLSFFLKLA